MLHDLLWQQCLKAQSAPVRVRSHVARVTAPLSTSPCVPVCVHTHVHLCRCLWAPGSHMTADWRQKPASHKLISWQSMEGGRDKRSLSAHTVTLSPSLDKPNLLKAKNVCAASSSSALTPLDQLARGQLWVQQLGQKGWWRTELYMEISFTICSFNLWTFEFWGPDPEFWACPPCTALQTLVQLTGDSSPQERAWDIPGISQGYASSLPLDAYIVQVRYPSKSALDPHSHRCQPGLSVWGKANPLSIFITVVPVSSLHTHWCIRKLLQPIQKK